MTGSVCEPTSQDAQVSSLNAEILSILSHPENPATLLAYVPIAIALPRLGDVAVPCNGRCEHERGRPI